MPRSILAPFQKFSAEGAAVGRLLAGYSNIEVGLMHCVQMARGGDLDTVLKKMFRIRGETRRINEAEKLGHADYVRLKLAGDFQKAIRVVRYCLKIRNQYSHWVRWGDCSGHLAFADLEELAERQRPVKVLAVIALSISLFGLGPTGALIWLLGPVHVPMPDTPTCDQAIANAKSELNPTRVYCAR